MDVKQKRQCGNNWCNVNCTGGKDCDCSLEKNNACGENVLTIGVM